MHMCTPHWAALKAEVERRGLSHLIKSAEDLHAAMVKEVKDNDLPLDKQSFDPLAGAMWAVYGAGINYGGFAALADDYCPLCAVERPGEPGSSDWVAGSVEDQWQIALRLQLVTPQ